MRLPDQYRASSRMEYAQWLAGAFGFFSVFGLLWPGRVFTSFVYGRLQTGVFGLLWPGRIFTSVVHGRLPTGGSPAATYFSCFAKKM
jgi:hypothetical protein